MEIEEIEMMWMVFARAPVPDAAYWPGRRWLAALDALGWPVAIAAALNHVPGRTGVLVPTITALLFVWGVARVMTAVWANHRYRFTTWRWGRVALILILVGLALKLALYMR